MQKNSDQFEQLGTKIDPAMAEELNAVCDSLQVDIYNLLQWFCYTLTRLRMQREVLLNLQKEYRGRTIDNIIDNINQRIKYYESNT